MTALSTAVRNATAARDVLRRAEAVYALACSRHQMVPVSDVAARRASATVVRTAREALIAALDAACQ